MDNATPTVFTRMRTHEVKEKIRRAYPDIVLMFEFTQVDNHGYQFANVLHFLSGELDREDVIAAEVYFMIEPWRIEDYDQVTDLFYWYKSFVEEKHLLD